MRQRTKNLLIVFIVALVAFEIGFQPLPLNITAKPQSPVLGQGFVRTLTYHFDSDMVGMAAEKPEEATEEPAEPEDGETAIDGEGTEAEDEIASADEEGTEADADAADVEESASDDTANETDDEANPDADDAEADETGEEAEDSAEEAPPLTRDDIIKQVRELVEKEGLLVEATEDAVSLPADNRVAIEVRLPGVRPRPGPLVPDEDTFEQWRRVALNALNDEYSSRVGDAKLVVEADVNEAEEDADLLVQLGPIRIERPRPRVALGLDLQGGVRTVLECVPVTTFRYVSVLPVDDEAPTEDATAEEPAEELDEESPEAAAAEVTPDAPADDEVADELTETDDTSATDWQVVADAVSEALQVQGATVDNAIGLERGIGITVRLTGTRNAAEGNGYQRTIEDALATACSEAMIQDDRTDILLEGTKTIDNVRNVVQRRVDGLGLTEPIIQTESDQRLIVEIPGQQPDESIIQPADLKFAQADMEKYAFSKRDVTTAAGKQIEQVIITDKRTSEEVEHKTFLSDPTTEMAFTGADLKDNCQARPDQQTTFWLVSFEFKPEKREEFRAYTARHVGDPLLIVLNDEVLMYPTIRSAIGGSGVIEGQFTPDDANELAVFLNAGALPIPLDIVETQQVSPTLGRDSISKSINAGAWGFLVVVLFMIFYYRLPGLVAGVALVIYLLLVVAAMVMLDATLTLHGIAGLILTVGIAVDANVLIFERLKEELRTGKSMRMAMETAFSRAWTAIVDSNVTTILAGVALLIFGTGGIKGFAICLIVGTLCSMISAVTITKLLMSTVISTRLANTSWLFLGAKEGR